jgi:transposase
VKGKRWLLLTRWVNLSEDKQLVLNRLFRLNRRVMKAYLLKESLDGLWRQTDEAAAGVSAILCKRLAGIYQRRSAKPNKRKLIPPEPPVAALS